MDGKIRDGDEAAIRALIGAHFEGMKWSPDMQADWSTFASDFLPEATLFPAARPLQSKSLDQFIERMKGLAQGALHTFEEHTRGMEILMFGNVAVVLAASEMLENGTEVNHDVSGYLLVKDDSVWRIAAHAWDKATEEMPVLKHLR
jgi:hypothetical protein